MAATTPVTGVPSRPADVRARQEDFYRDLHRHPELSHQKQRTAAAVAERLRGFGYQVHEGVGGAHAAGR